MNLDDWLHAAPAADIYVLGYEMWFHFPFINFIFWDFRFDELDVVLICFF